MVDTVRSLEAIQNLLADNVAGDISAQDMRDAILSLWVNTVPTWVQAPAYTSGQFVMRNGRIYQANDAIPANTAFTEGTTGATWQAVLDGSGLFPGVPNGMLMRADSTGAPVAASISESADGSLDFDQTSRLYPEVFVGTTRLATIGNLIGLLAPDDSVYLPAGVVVDESDGTGSLISPRLGALEQLPAGANQLVSADSITLTEGTSMSFELPGATSADHYLRRFISRTGSTGTIRVQVFQGTDDTGLRYMDVTHDVINGDNTVNLTQWPRFFENQSYFIKYTAVQGDIIVQGSGIGSAFRPYFQTFGYPFSLEAPLADVSAGTGLLEWTFDDTVGGEPPANSFRFDNADQASATALHLTEFSRYGRFDEYLLALPVGTYLYCQNRSDLRSNILFRTTGTITRIVGSTTLLDYFVVPVEVVRRQGTNFSDEATVTFLPLAGGAAARTGGPSTALTSFSINTPQTVNVGDTLDGTYTVNFTTANTSDISSITLTGIGDDINIPVPSTDGTHTQSVTVSNASTAAATTYSMRLEAVTIGGQTVTSNMQTVTVRTQTADELAYYGVRSTNDFAIVALGSLTSVDVQPPGAQYTISGSWPTTEFIGILEPADRPITSIVETAFNQETLSTWTRTASARTINGQAYDLLVQQNNGPSGTFEFRVTHG